MFAPVYTLRNGGVAITTAISALQLKAGTNGMIEILSAWAKQKGSTTSAQIGIALVRKSAAATVTAASAGTTLTKNNPANPSSDASLGTSASGITASSEGTDGETVHDEGFNVLSGFEFTTIPEARIYVPQGGIIALKFLDAPAAGTWYCGIRFRELRAG